MLALSHLNEVLVVLDDDVVLVELSIHVWLGATLHGKSYNVFMMEKTL